MPDDYRQEGRLPCAPWKTMHESEDAPDAAKPKATHHSRSASVATCAQESIPATVQRANTPFGQSPTQCPSRSSASPCQQPNWSCTRGSIAAAARGPGQVPPSFARNCPLHDDHVVIVVGRRKRSNADIGEGNLCFVGDASALAASHLIEPAHRLLRRAPKLEYHGRVAL